MPITAKHLVNAGLAEYVDENGRKNVRFRLIEPAARLAILNKNVWVVYHKYSDFAGSGLFFKCFDNKASWGINENTIFYNTEDDAKYFAARSNRPGTDDNWQVMPIIGPNVKPESETRAMMDARKAKEQNHD